MRFCQFYVSQSAHNSFATRAIVLKRFSIVQRIVETEFIHDCLQVVEPELRHELRAAARALCLWHLPGALLIKLNADRRGTLDHMKQLAKRQVEKRHDHRRLMRQSYEVIHVAVEP